MCTVTLVAWAGHHSIHLNPRSCGHTPYGILYSFRTSTAGHSFPTRVIRCLGVCLSPCRGTIRFSLMHSRPYQYVPSATQPNVRSAQPKQHGSSPARGPTHRVHQDQHTGRRGNSQDQAKVCSDQAPNRHPQGGDRCHHSQHGTEGAKTQAHEMQGTAESTTVPSSSKTLLYSSPQATKPHQRASSPAPAR